MADVVQPDAPAAPTHTTEKQAVEALVLPSDSEVANATPASSVEKAGKGKGLRALRDRIALRRSFSTKHASLSSPTLLSPTSEVDASEHEEEKTVLDAPATRGKPYALGRLISGKLGAKKNGKKTQDVDTSPIPVALDAVPSTSSASSRPEGEQPLESIPEATTVLEQEVVTETAPNADPEPLPLAQKIQSLLSSLPPFLGTLDSVSSPSDSNGQNGDAADLPSAIPDSRLISLLSSPSMMNGSLARGRQSVWALLDNLRLKSLSSPPSPGTRADADTSSRTSVETHTSEQTTVEDDDSVMFYGPLVPDAHSSVELARSEIVSVDENGTVVEVLLDDAPPPLARGASRPPSLTDGVLQAEKFSWHWPFHRSRPAPSPQPKTVEKRLWVPSTDKLSLQVMWWGYRLYVHRVLEIGMDMLMTFVAPYT